MFTYETADQKEVRRFRIAQFNGRTATVRPNGTVVTGLVRSIVENKSNNPPKWVITLIPSAPKAPAALLRSSPHIHSLVEDLY
jgi:hypothetical protein